MRFQLVLALLAATAVPSYAQDVTIVAPFEIKGMDPTTTGSVFQRLDVAETLVDVDQAGRLTPSLAENWSVSEDGLTWRFVVRPGVQFHDGSPLTAMAALGALRVAQGKPGPLAKAPIAGMEAQGDTVVIHLTQPYASLAAVLAEYRSQILAPAAYDGTDVVQVIGTGAFRVTGMAPPLQLQAERFDGYWGAAPAIAHATYQAVGRAETRALMAESGDADYVLNLDPASVSRLTGARGLSVEQVAIPRSLVLKVNAAELELEVRRALSFAIDREGLARAILRYPSGANQLFPPAVADWHDPDLTPLSHDPDEATRILASLGWTPGPDGILTREGERFSLTLTTYPDRPELPLVAAVLEQMLRQVGVELVIDATNSSEIPVRHADGTLDVALFARNFALLPDPLATLLEDYNPNGEWGAMNWENAEFTALLDKLSRGQGGDAERHRAMQILQQDLPVIPIAWYQQTAAISDRLKGARLDPYERSFGLRAMTVAE